MQLPSEPEPSARGVPCVEQSIVELVLFDEPASDAIEEDRGDYYETVSDATGGGLEATESYVYVRFNESGIEQVALGDEAAFSSTQWHLALRRYVLRVNSGVAGRGSSSKCSRTTRPFRRGSHSHALGAARLSAH